MGLNLKMTALVNRWGLDTTAVLASLVAARTVTDAA